MEDCEDLILSQEDEPGTHYSRRTVFHLDVNQSTLHGIFSRPNPDFFKRVSTSQMNAVGRMRRANRASNHCLVIFLTSDNKISAGFQIIPFQSSSHISDIAGPKHLIFDQKT